MAYGVNAPFGLKPSKLLTGAAWNGQTNEYPIVTPYTTAIYTNDPVGPLAAGGIGIGTNASTTGLLGSFQGCKYSLNGTWVFSPYWPNNGITPDPGTSVIAYVADDPNILFDIQTSNSQNGVNTAVTPLANLNLNANFGIGGGTGLTPPNPTAGSTTTGQSAYYLDFNTEAATSTLSLKIMNFTPYPGNLTATAFNNVLVLINTHALKSVGTAGI